VQHGRALVKAQQGPNVGELVCPDCGWKRPEKVKPGPKGDAESQQNVLRKIAQKRALTSAALHVAALSDVFGSDEDAPEGGSSSPPSTASKRQGPAAGGDAGYIEARRKAITDMLIQIVGADDPAAVSAELLRITANDRFSGWKSVDRIRSRKAVDITFKAVERALQELDLDQGDPNAEPPPVTDDDIPF
jgi:hypothetical protein